MPKLNEIETKFLELMHYNYNFRDNDDENIHLVGTHATNGVLDNMVYQYGNSILSIKKGKCSVISIIINNIQYTLEEFELDDGLTKTVISVGTYKGKKRVSIEIIPDSQMKNYAYLTTTITGTKTEKIHCSITEIVDDNHVLRLQASTNNYLVALKEKINGIDDSRIEIKDFFMKMLPLYQMIYVKLKAVPICFKDNYLSMLDRKARHIKAKADYDKECSKNKRLKDMLRLQSLEEEKYTEKLRKVSHADRLRRDKIQIDKEAALREIAWEQKYLYNCIEKYNAGCSKGNCRG